VSSNLRSFGYGSFANLHIACAIFLPRVKTFFCHTPSFFFFSQISENIHALLLARKNEERSGDLKKIRPRGLKRKRPAFPWVTPAAKLLGLVCAPDLGGLSGRFFAYSLVGLFQVDALGGLRHLRAFIITQYICTINNKKDPTRRAFLMGSADHGATRAN